MESGKIIVVANQKGGVAKTSTVRNLSYALAEMGKKVLVVDFDPQYNLTTSFGVLPTQTPCNTGTLITNLLLDESLPDTNEFIQKIGSVDLIPSSRSLTVAEANLLMTPDSNDYLAALLNPLRLSYDYIIVKRNQVRKIDQLERVVKYTFSNVGNTFSAKSIADYLKAERRSLDTRLSLLPIGDCLASLFSNRQHMMLYLCLQGFVSVLAVMFFLTNMRPYESDLDTITPEIQTPRAVGQYQHGSARWMTDSEKDKAFDSYILDPHNPTIRQLLDTGYDGLDFLKEK